MAEKYIRDFGAAEFAVRQAAVERLIAMGPDVRPLIEKTLDATKDAEARMRCEMVLKGLAAGAARATPPARLVERRVRTIPSPSPVPGTYFDSAWRGEGVAWLVTANGKNRVVFNGKEFPLHDGVFSLALSPDGRRAACIVRIQVASAARRFTSLGRSTGFLPSSRATPLCLR